MGGVQEIRHFLPVLSGKGGVGKSTVSASIAVALAKQGLKVGILDVDLCGPSIPKIFDVVEEHVLQSDSGWLPIEVSIPDAPPIKLMSMAFLLDNKDASVVWRGPKKSAMILQFFKDVQWGNLDILIVDTPPGTSDEHLALATFFDEDSDKREKLLGAILVTTPQWVSLSDVMKEIDFCHKTNIPIIGLIENMNEYICPNCHESFRIFSSKGGQRLAESSHLNFLASFPIDPSLAAAMQSTNPPFVLALSQSPSFQFVRQVADKIIALL